MNKYKDIIINRTIELRNKLNEIKSNRGKLDFLKNYYFNKTAIVIGTGPGYKDHLDVIKNNINENTILICIKQSIKDFDMICDFHAMNLDHYEDYNYDESFKPIVLFTNYSLPDENNYRESHPSGDINYFIHNLKGIDKKLKIFWDCVLENEECLIPNDENLGPDENMSINTGHIMFETVIPLIIQLGIKNIILNGYVGGSSHGTIINNELKWEDNYAFLNDLQNDEYNRSKYLPKYLFDHYGIHIFSICKTNYHIEQITQQEFINIINFKNLFIFRAIDGSYDIGVLVRYFIKIFEDLDTTISFLKNGIKIISYFNLINNHYLFNDFNSCIDIINKDIWFNNAILFGIHPVGFETIISKIKLNIIENKKMKIIGWNNDPHYFAHFVDDRKDNNLTVQEYSKSYDSELLNRMDYLITPSSIYFYNLKMEKYYNKIVKLFYLLPEIDIDITDYNSRLNQILLSGAISFGYKSRYDFFCLKNKNKSFNDLITILQHPGYNKPKSDTFYYSELCKYKGAFVGHYIFPLNFLLAKHIEVLYCGCLGFFENNPLLEKELGLIEYVHYIPCSDENNNIIQDEQFYLKWLNSEEGNKIAENGKKYVTEKFGKSYIKYYQKFFESL